MEILSHFEGASYRYIEMIDGSSVINCVFEKVDNSMLNGAVLSVSKVIGGWLAGATMYY